MASARAYEHLVACDLVEPCVWVEASAEGDLMGLVIGRESVPVNPSAEDDWWQPERVPLLELVASLEPSRIRLIALVLPGDRPPSGAGSDW